MESSVNPIEEVTLMRLIRSSARANEQILGQLKLFREIVGKLNIAIFIHDLKMLRHIWTNNNYVNIIGYTDSEIKSFTPEWAKDNYHPDDFYILQERIEYFLQNKGDAYAGVYRVKHREGHWVWVYSNSIVFKRDEEGMVEQILGICIDFSNNFKTEAQLDDLYHENLRLRNQLNVSSLTQREREIIKHIAGGKTCQQIALLLNISSHTANNHRKHILKKLKLKNIADLSHFASMTGID